jgi:hypothetical protein
MNSVGGKSSLFFLEVMVLRGHVLACRITTMKFALIAAALITVTATSWIATAPRVSGVHATTPAGLNISDLMRSARPEAGPPYDAF